MALIVEFICELPNGVHARPASHVETLCNTFSSQIEWHNLRTDRKGNAKSALALIGTDPWLAILPCANIYWQASAPD